MGWSLGCAGLGCGLTPPPLCHMVPVLLKVVAYVPPYIHHKFAFSTPKECLARSPIVRAVGVQAVPVTKNCPDLRILINKSAAVV